jgi:hypothetical protein
MRPIFRPMAFVVTYWNIDVLLDIKLHRVIIHRETLDYYSVTYGSILPPFPNNWAAIVG